MIKHITKQFFRLILILVILPFAFLHFLVTPVSGKGLFLFFNQLLSLVPGGLGSYLRLAFNHLVMTHCDQNAVIGFLTLFSQVDTEIHENVYIGPQCNIGSCKIGKNTLIASGVHIMSGSGQHNFDDLDTPIQQQGGHYEKISIGEDCWIGNGALIMADIGNKCIIGAGSVVTKPVPDFSIAVGNPAKVVKSRLSSQ